MFYFPDGSVWMFQEYPLKEPSLDGYLQTVAVNVSEIYYNGEEIKNNNEKLEFLNRKLEEMYEKIGDEIREQETLSMKMQVHDSFGRSLLSIRRILEKKEEPENMKEQLDTLKQLEYIQASHPLVKAELATWYAMHDDEQKAEEYYDKAIICGFKEPEQLSKRMTALRLFNHAEGATGSDLPQDYYRKKEKEDTDAGNV